MFARLGQGVNTVMQRLSMFAYLWLCAHVVTAAEHWQDPAYIAQSFTHIALQNEYDRYAHPLRRWEVPVKVHLIYHAPKEALYEELMQMHLAHLAQITGHDIQLTPHAKQANLRVIFTLESRWKQDIQAYISQQSLAHANSSVCMATIRTDKRHAITQAVVIIPVDQAQRHRKLVSCIVEELTQVMGLPNDAESVYPSIFNDKTPDDLLTGLDGLLLKLLYHPKLKSGMRKQAVNRISQQILNDWVQDGTIKNANTTMRQGALYPLLGY